ncbi:glycosyltransferase family 2 protein [Oryzomonas sagensis]|uniref:Glycosyltransferase family 2 protein n=1 Tax=Oryzomonas sagensis TaxID=2603857 RepID=A0ABQ6TM72_9BACT|nr:glycosyltransferase family A protein [Oryzomonas sagensis]KAB0669559.1 glycosyltransferase family 2 protein [Oryzomonas sagensis]
MRRLLLTWLYKVFPFDLRGDCPVPPARDNIRISCIINFYGRLDLLSGILHSLAQQRYPRERFEVVLVEDQNGTDGGRDMAERFTEQLQIVYLPLDANFGKMGYSRNFGLSRTRGEIVLFLDDDTVILQQDFLTVLDDRFGRDAGPDAVVPHGHAGFSLVRGHYGFHDPYFMTSRCTAYRREVLAELGGFMAHFVGQEDVEFVVRFLMAGKRSENVPELNYFHPPLLVPNFRKPRSVGHSFYGLRSRYPLPIWLIIILNCSRHAPLYLLPMRRCREMGRFGIGFFTGVVVSLFKKEGFQYN